MKIVGQIELPEVKKEKVQVTIKEKVLVYFQSGKDGKVIGRLDNGKIAIIDKNSKTSVLSGETWKCKIILDDTYKTIVSPIYMVKSVGESIKELSDSLIKLKEAGIKTSATFNPKDSFLYAKSN